MKSLIIHTTTKFDIDKIFHFSVRKFKVSIKSISYRPKLKQYKIQQFLRLSCGGCEDRVTETDNM